MSSRDLRRGEYCRPRNRSGEREGRFGELGAVILVWVVLVTCWHPPAARGQGEPGLDVGWIMQTDLKKSGRDPTPLQINRGDTSFLNKWVVLFEARVDPRLSVFAEVQTIRGLSIGLYALSAVYRLRSDGYLHVEAGKFLAPFGNFLTRRWASENPLVDFPLLYNYRTAVSATQVPRTKAILLSVRGSGQDLRYPDLALLGKRLGGRAVQSAHLPRPNWGLRVVSRDVYLTGLQLFGSTDRLFYALAFTNGALSNPVDINNTDGVQVIGRLRVTPVTGLDVATSFSSAPYLNKGAVGYELAEQGLNPEQFRQWVWGADLAYSRGHAVLFAELMFNRWETPFLGEDLDLWGAYVEAKYTVAPRLFVAGRWSRLVFSEISDPSDIDGDGRLREPWDYDVRQIELGMGYRLTRNALLKATFELNRTLDPLDGDPSDDSFALQAVVFF